MGFSNRVQDLNRSKVLVAVNSIVCTLPFPMEILQFPQIGKSTFKYLACHQDLHSLGKGKRLSALLFLFL